MNKRKLISALKWDAKMAAYKANHCTRVLQCEDLTDAERKEWETTRIYQIGRESAYLDIVDELKIGAIK